MTGAMYAAVSGLRSHMNALNVIGQNVSNVNTLGYKSARYTFSEALYTYSRYGSNGSETVGGHNPAQYGYGCSLGTIDLDMSTKNYSPTGVGLDCMIDGDGFFIIGDKNDVIDSPQKMQAATLTRLGNLEFHDGYLVDGNGSCIMGFGCTGLNEEETEEGQELSPVYSNILSPLHYPLLVPSEENEGEYTLQYSNGEEDEELPENVRMPVISSISIDEKTGLITGVCDETNELVYIGYIAIAKVDNPNGVSHVDGRYYKGLAGAGGVHATAMGGAVRNLTANEEEEESGLIIESAGDTKLISGGLESSGTDLANEISNMIVIQRGYQANTRIVTVTDSMLEELVNMKR